MKHTSLLRTSAVFAALVLSFQLFAEPVNPRFEEFPLGAIKPKGWLERMLNDQKNGLTSRMDTVYPEVMGARNGWLGGDGDQWERGPYWIDGLLPLAYILDDKELIAKAQVWVESILSSQQENGQFGPMVDYDPEPGIQRNNAQDWWPRMVALKILKQYYSATGDERVIPFLDRYFRYQLATLPEKPLGNWTFWARFRAADNMEVALWLYRKTGEKYLLDLADLLDKQGFDFTKAFMDRDFFTTFGSIHCVNLAQGFKEPVIYYMASGDQHRLDAAREGLREMIHAVGYPTGMYGGDEALRNNNPTQGTELCSVVELMYSLEEMYKVTGDPVYAEHLERVAFNALPTQITDDFMGKQYFQQVNQVQVGYGKFDFDVVNGATTLVFGNRSGYPCCLSNFHQGWPKFVQNLWLRTEDGGIAVGAFSPSTLNTTIGDSMLTIDEDTQYPMGQTITMTVSLKKKQGRKKVVPSSETFPISFRIPSWTKKAKVAVNGESVQVSSESVCLNREWRDGDTITIDFPMSVKTGRWYNHSAAVERGPLVYALRIEEEWKTVKATPGYGETWREVYPKSDWNYALRPLKTQEYVVNVDEEKLSAGSWWWNLEGAPITIEAAGVKVPTWSLYNGMAGPLPTSRRSIDELADLPTEKIVLIPYGCTTLRITEFPVACR